MKPEPSTAQFRFVCFHCRKMIRKPLPRTRYSEIERKPEGAPCAECGNALIFVGRYFEPPRRNDVKAWKKIELRCTEKEHWFRTSCGPSKYYAKIPRRLAQEKRDEEVQRALCQGKGIQQQQRLEKKQVRLASHSKPGRSLTSRTLTTDDRWLSLEQKI